jgi:hypothetical protein
LCKNTFSRESLPSAPALGERAIKVDAPQRRGQARRSAACLPNAHVVGRRRANRHARQVERGHNGRRNKQDAKQKLHVSVLFLRVGGFFSACALVFRDHFVFPRSFFGYFIFLFLFQIPQLGHTKSKNTQGDQHNAAEGEFEGVGPWQKGPPR